MGRGSRAIAWARQWVDVTTVGKFTAAVLAGLGVGLALTFEPVTYPVVGSVHSAAIGVLLFATGAFIFTQMPDPDAGCGCTGECDCS